MSDLRPCPSPVSGRSSRRALGAKAEAQLLGISKVSKGASEGLMAFWGFLSSCGFGFSVLGMQF